HSMVAYAWWGWPWRTSMDGRRVPGARGMDPRLAGGEPPKNGWTHLALLAALAAVGWGSKAEDKNYDPVSPGMVSTDAPFYDDGDTQIYQSKRPISFPILTPTDAQKANLATPVAPYARTPWITKHDVRVQISWTLSNLDTDYHNIEILIDPWNEFARYVPAINVGEE